MIFYRYLFFWANIRLIFDIRIWSRRAPTCQPAKNYVRPSHHQQFHTKKILSYTYNPEIDSILPVSDGDDQFHPPHNQITIKPTINLALPPSSCYPLGIKRYLEKYQKNPKLGCRQVGTPTESEMRRVREWGGRVTDTVGTYMTAEVFCKQTRSLAHAHSSLCRNDPSLDHLDQTGQ